MRKKTWKIRSSNHGSARSLADALQIPPALARILVSRGMSGPKEASAFLHASLDDLSRPFQMPNMGAAVEVIGEAIEKKRKIVVYGDYDVDGICASVLMAEALSWLGVSARIYIPSRFHEGYGLNEAALQTLLADGWDFVITVDNGIAARDMISAYQAKGMTFVVTDHHQLPEALPKAITINPHLFPDQNPAYGNLCGCGTAYFLAMGLLIRLAPELYDMAHRRQLLDLVAVATIADLVPLLDDNRILVREGLAQLNASPRPGLAALVDLLCGQETITAADIAYRVAPCINACGRLDHTDVAVRLFTADDGADIQALAEQVQAYNNERKEIEKNTAKEAIAQFAEATGEMTCAIAVGENWHPGVIGVVSSRLAEYFHCPAIVLTTTEDNPEEYTGSARSVKGFHLFEGLQAVSEHLVKYGGHEMAAGLTLKKDALDAFKRAFKAVTDAHKEEITEDILWIDDVIKLDEVGDDLEEALRLLEPCGMENKKPLFALEHQSGFGHQPVGAEGEHLRLMFATRTGETLAGIAFKKGQYAFLDKHRYDFAFHLTRNCFRGNCKVQLQVEDIMPSWQASEDKVFSTFMWQGDNYLQSGEMNSLVDKPFFFTKVRGVSFDTRQAAIAKLQVGDRVQLLRETNNQNDANAVACFSASGDKLGYLSRDIAAVLAPVMDLGAQYEAQIENITGTEEQHQGVNLCVCNKTALAAETAPAGASALEGLGQAALIELLTDAFLDDGALLPIQEAAIRNIVHKHEDTAVIMPTGRGKSLIYQIAAGVLARSEGRCTIVISPLKALIEDQYLALVNVLSELGYRIYKGNGDLSSAERQKLRAALEEEQLDILLTTPEFFVHHQDVFKAHKEWIGQIVIDEAHYLVGKRSAYKTLRELKPSYNNAVWTILTATVPTTEVEAFKKIISGAGLYIDDHIRYNLHIIDGRATEQKLLYLYRLFMHPEKTICYVNSRKQAFGLARRLRELLPYQLRPLVGYYHGGLPLAARRATEAAFKEGDIRLLFATTAFGEGMHIPDIRHVVLYHPCFSLEAFNQLAGRCARDGEEGKIHLLYGERDFALNEMIVGEGGLSREQLGQMYQRLKAQSKASGYVLECTKEMVDEALAKAGEGFTRSQWRLALTIFSELGFLDVHTGPEGYSVRIQAAPPKRQLTESHAFLEGQSELRALEQFHAVAFTNNIATLEALVRSALRPENLQGREVKT